MIPNRPYLAVAVMDCSFRIEASLAEAAAAISLDAYGFTSAKAVGEDAIEYVPIKNDPAVRTTLEDFIEDLESNAGCYFVMLKEDGREVLDVGEMRNLLATLESLEAGGDDEARNLADAVVCKLHFETLMVWTGESWSRYRIMWGGYDAIPAESLIAQVRHFISDREVLDEAFLMEFALRFDRSTECYLREIDDAEA